MGFFKDLNERIGDYTLTLTITKDKGQLIVMLVPKLEAKKDDALKEIIPLTVKGTPDQLDAGFILAISQGISLTTGLQTNIKEFEAGIKKAEKKIKGKDDKTVKTEDVKTDVSTDDDDDDTAGVSDEMPFGDDKVDTDTGEIKEEAPKEIKEPDPPKKEVAPKAKTAEPKAKKEPEPAASALTGIIQTTDDDEWN